MRTLLFTSSLLLLAAACEQNGLQGIDDTARDDTGTPDDTDVPWQQGSDGEEIWELTYEHEPCKEYIDSADGMAYQIPGATRFFAGDYSLDEEDLTVSGKEYLLLVANPGWKDAGEDDCQVVWAISGTLEEGACPGCDYSFHLTAELNDSQSNCPAGFQDLESHFEVSYDVSLLSSGDSEFRFLDSGNLFGAGWWADERAAWISDPACYWF